MAKIVSVIDIGSNSVRMAIFAKTSRFGFYLLEEKKSRVRISEGSYENGGILQEVPMRRTILALSQFAQIAKERGSRKVFCVATSAVRDAPNAKAFLKQVKNECGLQIRIIDGKKEAYYGALACLNLLHQKEGISIDVGGGSSECAVLESQKISELYSIDIGAIRLKELFFDGKEDIAGAKAMIKKSLLQLPAGLKSDVVFGIGGSIRALTKMIAKEEGIQFLHGIEIDAKSYIAFCDEILHSSSQKLRDMGFGEDRIDSIRSGALIFAMFLEHFEVKNVITSGVGVREGVFLEDLLRGHHYRFPHNFNPSLKSLLDRFEYKKSRAVFAKQEALKIFDTLQSYHCCNQYLKKILAVASRLCFVGEALGMHMQSLHSAYFAFNGLEYGFSLSERFLLKTLLESKKIPKENKSNLLSLFELRVLSSILILAKALAFPSSMLQYTLKGKNTLVIFGASYLAREQIKKVCKCLEFEVEFGEKFDIAFDKKPKVCF